MAPNKQAQRRCPKGDENLFKRVYRHSSAENGDIRLNRGKLHHCAWITKKTTTDVPKGGGKFIPQSVLALFCGKWGNQIEWRKMRSSQQSIKQTNKTEVSKG